MFDEEAKAVQETAKATQELAKVTGKGIDSASNLGRFFAKFITGPLEQASGMLEDHLKFVRWDRRVRLAKRAQDIMIEQGLEIPTRAIPLKVAIPLLEAASIEEDDELQDIWARLLVNAADADSGTEVSHSFVSIAKEFGRLEVQILAAIYAVPPERRADGVRTRLLPESVEEAPENMPIGQPSEEVQVALWNLLRLGCIASTMAFGGTNSVGHVCLTQLGERLVRACTTRAHASTSAVDRSGMA